MAPIVETGGVWRGSDVETGGVWRGSDVEMGGVQWLRCRDGWCLAWL